LTPYPGTKLDERLHKSGRILQTNWDRYDTRHAVFNPNRMSVTQSEQGYWKTSTFDLSTARKINFNSCLDHGASLWKEMRRYLGCKVSTMFTRY
jgi:hypothetical protein